MLFDMFVKIDVGVNNQVCLSVDADALLEVAQFWQNRFAATSTIDVAEAQGPRSYHAGARASNIP
jgi:hypothetical protein